ncbi:hypothetical protein MASR2M74_10430 [Paracoccaceae bacterium]
MITELLNVAADRIFEIMSLLVAVVALVYAMLALRVAKQANQIAKESNIAALRVRLRDEVSAAQINPLGLQEACQRTKSQWERYWIKHVPAFGRPSGIFHHQPKETRHIVETETAGRKLFQRLSEATVNPVSNNAIELESHIIFAQQTAMEIDQLSLRLEGPKPFGQ